MTRYRRTMALILAWALSVNGISIIAAPITDEVSQELKLIIQLHK